MIALSLAQVAAVVGGEVTGGPRGSAVAPEDVVVDGPVVIDGREAGPGSLFAAFVGEHSDGHEHAAQAGRQGAVAVLGSRPTELPTVVVDDPRLALQRLAAHVVERVRRDGGLTVVGITGSQGKTSTKDLLGAVLSEAAPTVATRGSFNNELGMPLTALRVETGTRYLVLELGARGLGHIAELTALVRPDVSLVLNVGQAHLGEFGSREAIAQAKGELVEALDDDGTAVLNADDERVAAMASRTGARVVSFGAQQPADVRVEELELDRLGRPSFVLVADGARVPVRLRLVGAHQALNAAAAAAAAIAAGLEVEQVAAALGGVSTLSQWRMELSELPNGVTVLNDSYNANPDSMRAAIDALASIGADPGVRRTVAVLGEMRELGETSPEEHRGVGAYAVDRGVDVVVVVGEAARGIHEGAGERSLLLADNAAAGAWLAEHLAEGDAVLFKASRGARLDEVAAGLQ
ncbi:UDP-N-acetylmuramoyl-tripeptide--D-alanyl-D-alanine ligase [Nocardioides sp. OK12]|uniref:UDP-N-acetylmuramoyl-tripeptide--D-alanyl-D- alanine ligase n=1 Tax=Nocardioides sp. OK12 TaxID=2758661 RepID=UPI0021C364CE|nr:UDP-N-acetylmuramoyl-tripeptide--D-alanyl-D-alanine ligase [Nocardioides sp. OK12]GHJ57978.1 UDP-N-acetylmuramoyl-tripeptide--D-alanyl-D-alanine ligase [Nocardioides sp. OK12]